ncbi:hypothetical protein [Candidatus Pantoea bituminis]|uniref:hypothetical protein n=1 Tax=Candidatus Pantoea bituminis TaxID=2831036 RepID=UPI001C06337A|nr:hypothetical protein [Pantoea bituminis]
MKSAINMAKVSEKNLGNNVLEQIKLQVSKDTIKLIESDIQVAASLGMKNCERHIHGSVHETVIQEIRDNGYTVQIIGIDPAAGSAHIKLSW